MESADSYENYCGRAGVMQEAYRSSKLVNVERTKVAYFLLLGRGGYRVVARAYSSQQPILPTAHTSAKTLANNSSNTPDIPQLKQDSLTSCQK